jgi:hypothetical protein
MRRRRSKQIITIAPVVRDGIQGYAAFAPWLLGGTSFEGCPLVWRETEYEALTEAQDMLARRTRGDKNWILGA